jgi:hypothetical protein
LLSAGSWTSTSTTTVLAVALVTFAVIATVCPGTALAGATLALVV